MFSLELFFGVLRDGSQDDDSVVIVKFNGCPSHLFAIAQDTDFRQWAADNGCAFVEIWADSGNLVYMQRVTRK